MNTRPERGFYNALEDRYPIGKNSEAIGLRELMQLLKKQHTTASNRGRQIISKEHIAHHSLSGPRACW